MILAKIRVDGVRVTPVEVRDIPKGIIGGQVAFEYTDPMWDGLTKTVVFQGAVTKDVVDAGELVTIPQEVVAKTGVTLRVGVYGTDAGNNIAIPTIWADVDLGKVRAAADPSGDESTDPSLPVWAQLEGRIEELEQNGTGSVDESVVQGMVEDYLEKNPPAPGEDGEDGITPHIGENGNWYIGDTDTGKPSRGEAGKDGDTPQKGTDYFDGEDGGYYTPTVSQPDANTVTFSFAPSDADMPEAEPVTVTLPPGPQGPAGADAPGSYTIPDYWQEHLDARIAAIKALQDAGGSDCFSFVVLTDMHYYSNLGKRSPALAEEICRRIGARFVLQLGDVQNRGSWPTKEEAEAEWVEIDAMFEPVRERLLSEQGNHDGSWGAALNGVSYPYNFTTGELYERIFRKTAECHDVHTDASGTAYYVDDPSCRVRYILLNTQCNPTELNEDGSAKYNNMKTFRFTQSQYDFLTGEALTTGLTEDWAVIVAAHAPINNVYSDLFGGANGDHTVMRGLLKAFTEKTAYSGSFAGTAGAPAAYTNAAGTITTDVRLSSSGDTKDSAGAAVTDYIACAVGDALRVKGLDITSGMLPDAANSPSINVYDSSKAFLGVVYPTSTHSGAFSTDTDGSTLYTLFLNNGGVQITSLASAAYIRICGTPIDGEDIIVTLNEQILESSGESGYDAVSVDADFTNAPGELVGWFCGHIHSDNIYGYADYFGFNIVTHRCDAAEENDAALKAERIAGTITEQSFDVVTVSRATRKIYCTKIGAGADREAAYPAPGETSGGSDSSAMAALTFTGAVSATYDGSKPVTIEIPESGGGIEVSGASVGQTIKISAVDENGVPTAWEPVDLPSGDGGSCGCSETAEEAQLASGTLAAETAVNTFTPTGVTLGDLRKYRRFVFVWKGASNTGTSNMLLQFSATSMYASYIARFNDAGGYNCFEWLDEAKTLLRTSAKGSGNPSMVNAIGTSLIGTVIANALTQGILFGTSSAQIFSTEKAGLTDDSMLYLLNPNTPSIDYNWEIRGLTV